jgi:hypothetical protein
VVLAAVASLPPLARRRAPLSVFALSTAASATINALGYPLAPPLAPTVALFFVANDNRTPARLGQIGIVVISMFAVHIGAFPGAYASGAYDSVSPRFLIMSSSSSRI